jgi:hypothetical protein
VELVDFTADRNGHALAHSRLNRLTNGHRIGDIADTESVALRRPFQRQVDAGEQGLGAELSSKMRKSRVTLYAASG